MNICIAYPNKKLTFSETFILNHLKYIPHEFELTGGKCPFLDKEGKSIFSFPFSINIIRAFFKIFLPLVYKVLYSKALSNYLIKNKIDVVLAEYGHTGINVLKGCKKAKVELIVHYHGFDASVYSILKKYRKNYIKIAEYAKKIVVVSEDMRKELIQLGMREDRFINIPYGIDPERFFGAHPEENDKICIFVGRFTPKKAPDKLILAFNEVLKEHPEAKLLLVGFGELIDETKKQVKDLNIQNSVEFLGVKSPEDIAKLLQKSRVFIQHSVRALSGDSEGTPNTILESCASGLPVVSTKHAGIKEAVIHGKTGYLVDEGDYLEMAKFINLLLSDNKLSGQLGQEARKYINENYNLEKQIKRLNDVILS